MLARIAAAPGSGVSGTRAVLPRTLSRTAWGAIALLVTAAPGADGTTAGEAASYSCTFQDSWAECGFTAQSRGSDRISPVEVAGVRGVRLETLPGDSGVAGSGTAARTDLALSPGETGCSPGAEQWWTHEVLFPDDYVLPQVTRADPWPWGVVFDFHHTGSTGQANFEVEVAGQPPEMRFAISGGPEVSNGAPGSPTRRFPVGPIVRNHWYRFVYHVRWSAEQDGVFAAWVDGRHVLDYRGPTLYAGQECYLKLANYHTPVGRSVAVVHAQLKRAPTAAALGLGALQ